MGDHRVHNRTDQAQRNQFLQHLLKDIEALELMLQQNLIESGIRRIGAEQEFCLVDAHCKPSKEAIAILEAIADDHFTTELATYNLEINLDPFELNGKAFSLMEAQLKELLNKAQKSAAFHNQMVLLCGILPTISKTELDLEYMTPNPRYFALNERLKGLRGEDFHLHLSGVDELTISHESVLFEACNTSFQMHLQVDADDFISSYNWSQAIAGPVLGIATNSPLLLGRELWNESRIALFQQSIDTRSASFALKEQQARVSFGTDWESGSIASLYQKEIARFKVILTQDIEEDSLQLLKEGKIPKLKALNLHNGTIYRWNRACYGVGNGKPHLRIENRYIPSGPSVIDEMANMAFWVGLMLGRPSNFDHMPDCMDFKAAKANFTKAARYGKDCLLNWEGEKIALSRLVEEKLLPIAVEGLKSVGVKATEIDRLLQPISKRCHEYNGAEWQIENYRKLRKVVKKDQAAISLCEAMIEAQKTDKAVTDWPAVKVDSVAQLGSDRSISHLMSADLHTVRSNDLLSLAKCIMQWKDIHHLPVENDNKELCGVISWKAIEKYEATQSKEDTLVHEIMNKNVLTVPFTASIEEAIDLMKRTSIGCLPVMEKKQLIGIVTVNDILAFEAAHPNDSSSAT
ncbi:MAG: CBS domain-containing protein [Vicingaceae bacterium]